MTIPKIVLVSGSKDTENITLWCTGCDETFNYSVRQYKGDFGCNISEFEHFLQWAKWEAAKHECFLAGRMGYMPPIADEFIFSGDSPGVRAERRYAAQLERDPLDTDHGPPFAESEEDLLGGMFPERREDSWGEEAMRAAVNPLVQGNAPDGTPYAEKDDVQGGYWPDEFDNEDYYESADLDDDEPFSFLYGEPTQFKTYGSPTGRLPRGSHFTVKVEVVPPAPVEFDIFYFFSEEFDTDEGGPTGAVIEFDYAELEQRIVDEEMLRAGIYNLDEGGCLRDEKNRCLACLRPGPHLPFYWKRDHGR